MLNQIKDFVMANLLALLAALLVLVAGFAAWQTVRIDGFGIWPFKSIGLKAKVENLREHLADAERELVGTKEALDASEVLRALELELGVGAYEELADRCGAQVKRAQVAGQVIGEIVNGKDAHGAGAGHQRDIVGADRLRLVVGQGAGGDGDKADGLPHLDSG